MKLAAGHKSKISLLQEALITCRIMFKYALIFGCIINILMLATPIYSMQVLDRVISSGNTDTLLMLTLVIVLALSLLSLLQTVRSFAMTRMGDWFEKRLSAKLLGYSVKAALVNKGAGGSQQLRDLQTIKTFLTSPSVISILDIPWAIIFVIVLFIIHTYMGVMTVIGGLILLGIAILSDRITKSLHDVSNEHFIASMRQVDQATRNAEVIEVMGMMPNIEKSWQEINHKVQTNQNLVSDRQTLLSEITKFIRMVLQILVTGVGAFLVLKGEMSTGAIIACSSLSGRALAPFEQSIMSWKAFINARKSYDRLQEHLGKFGQDEERMSLPAPEGRVTAENIFFAPPGAQKHILKSVNFAVEPGETLIVIGPSASGKTTLAKLLVGVWPPQIGSIRIDNASLTDWNRIELGRHLGYLPQDVELFSGTVKDNIARMDKDAIPEDVIEAAQIAGIHDMILQLPKGYDTEIGSDGAALSGGQRQRVALARAFYGNPKILILDEPNSNLDSLGEMALTSALTKAKEKNVTCIVISHRPTLLSNADKIMAMKDGMVAIFGSRDEVLEKMNQAAKAVPQDLLKKHNT
jgi:PrtD family type I secretion system ABC transporter